jgi:isopenicillin N synthase-like dioxygenase
MKNIHSIADLETKGYVRLDYPNSIRTVIREAVDSWKKFCNLPENVRSKFAYNPSAGMGVGYELKKKPGQSLDLKEDFLFTTGMRKWLADAAVNVGDEAASELVRSASHVSNVIIPMVMEFAREIERKFGFNGFAQEIADSQDVWYLRFLHYFGERAIGDEIATAHADKSGFTLHLYESDPGLQFLDFNKKWIEAPVSADETVIIPGMRLQYRSKNQLKALFHRVVATKKTAKTGRFSIVLFVHPKRTPEYNKAGAGRLQEFEPGFNYSMPFDEFAKLFVVAK